MTDTLDLRVVERWRNSGGTNAWCATCGTALNFDAVRDGCDNCKQRKALLAHCRALRAALEHLLMTTPKKRDPGSFYDQALHEAAAVLAQATDA